MRTVRAQSRPSVQSALAGYRRVRQALGWTFDVAVAALVVLVILALMGQWLTPYDPIRQNLGARLEGPTGAHPLGTDALGRDVLSRMLTGARPALAGVVVTIATVLVIALPWGLIAGYGGRALDELLMRIADGVLAIPPVALAIAIVGVMGPTVRNAMIALGVIYSPTVARLLRSSVLTVRDSEYVTVSRLLGAGRTRVALRHVLPNAVAPALVQVGAIGCFALLAQAALGFLGIATDPPHPSWGSDLADAHYYFNSAPFLTVAPGLVITCAALALSRLGDGLRVAARLE